MICPLISDTTDQVSCYISCVFYNNNSENECRLVDLCINSEKIPEIITNIKELKSEVKKIQD